MENSKFITSWQEVHTIVDDAMAKGDRSVSIRPENFIGLTLKQAKMKLGVKD